MTFASEIAKRSSYRDALARISVRRNYTGSLANIVIDGNADYWFGLLPPGPVEAVYRNGIALTKHEIPAGDELLTDDLAPDEYAVTVTTSSSTLWLKIDGAPDSETNVIVVVYTLHYGTDKVRGTWDPEDDSTDLVRWEPRLLNDPEVGTYFDNILAGVLSIADATIEIADADNVFKDFLTSNDSFRSARVTVWGIVNGTGNVRKIYTGEVTALSRQGGAVTLSVVDVALRLRQPAYMGDTTDEAIFTATGFPAMDPNKKGRPCPFVTGEASRHRTRAVGVSGTLEMRMFDPEDTNEAVCVDFDKPTVTNNRVWALCRVPGSVRLNAFTSLTRVSYVGSGFFLAYANGSEAAYKVGDSFQWTESGTSYSGTVFYAGAISSGGLDYNLLIGDAIESTGLIHAAGGDLTTSSTSIEAPAVALLYQFGDDPINQTLHLRCDRDFTVSLQATSGGNNLVKITLVDDFEANSFLTVLDPPVMNPQSHKLLYRVTSDSPMGHGALLERICEEAGLTVDGTTFDQADTDLPVETYMQIPASRENDYEEYLRYAELVCKSTLGFLTANADGEMVYRLIEVPAGGDTLDENTAALRGYSVDYNDVVTGLIGINQDLASEDEVIEESAEAEHLHNVKRVVPFYHVLRDISGRLPDILEIMRKRKVIYSHTAPHVALSREIGDEATIDHDEVMGGSGSANVLITGIRKTMDETTIESTDLGGG